LSEYHIESFNSTSHGASSHNVTVTQYQNVANSQPMSALLSVVLDIIRGCYWMRLRQHHTYVTNCTGVKGDSHLMFPGHTGATSGSKHTIELNKI